MWRPTIALSTFELTYHTRIIELIMDEPWSCVPFHAVGGISGLIDFAQCLRGFRHTMLRPRPLSLPGEYPSCSAPQGIDSKSDLITYWLSSTWHVSPIPATAASGPLSIVWMNVVRNDWHLYKPWRLIDWPRLLHDEISSTAVFECSMNARAMRLAVKSTQGM